MGKSLFWRLIMRRRIRFTLFHPIIAYQVRFCESMLFNRNWLWEHYLGIKLQMWILLSRGCWIMKKIITGRIQFPWTWMLHSISNCINHACYSLNKGKLEHEVLLTSSSSSFSMAVNDSASAKLSTAIAKKTFSNISEIISWGKIDRNIK